MPTILHIIIGIVAWLIGVWMLQPIMEFLFGPPNDRRS